MITFRHKGNFSKTFNYFSKLTEKISANRFEKYGKMGVDALMSATPVDTGLTSRSWYYTIEQKDGYIYISFNNSNVQNGINIAVILQYGHATRNGGWVEGRDYINPAIRPIFDNIAKEAWEEVTKV